MYPYHLKESNNFLSAITIYIAIKFYWCICPAWVFVNVQRSVEKIENVYKTLQIIKYRLKIVGLEQRCRSNKCFYTVKHHSEATNHWNKKSGCTHARGTQAPRPSSHIFGWVSSSYLSPDEMMMLFYFFNNNEV